VPLEHDRRAVIRFDRGAKVRPKRPVAAPLWVVRPAKATIDLAFAPSFGDVEVLLPVTAEGHLPSLWIGETDPVRRFKPHWATVSNAVDSHKIAS
jgi:hypothetical protein